MSSDTAQSQNIAVAQKDVRTSIVAMRPEFQKALPPHVTPDKFERVVLTAINGNPALLTADRRTLYAACMRAAADGLLPDGREGALVTYGKDVQWMPMVGGILKKIRNSGELRDISVAVVYPGDDFKYWTDEQGEHLYHEKKSDTGQETHAYAIARTKDGGVYIDVMSRARIEKARASSKSKNGPAWNNWWDEMAAKTVLRHLSKRLPMSTDIEETLRADDAADFDRATGEISAKSIPPGRLATVIDRGKQEQREQLLPPDDGGRVIEDGAIERPGHPADDSDVEI